MHLTLVLLVGIFSTQTLQQCPPPSPGGCSGGCPPATDTSTPAASGCPTTTTSTPTTTGCPSTTTTSTPTTTACPSTTTTSTPTTTACPSTTTTSTPATTGCSSTTTTSSPTTTACPSTTTPSTPATTACPSTTTTSTPTTTACPSTTTTSSPATTGCPSTTQSPCSDSGSGPSPGNGAGNDSCTHPTICENVQASDDVTADSDSPYYDQVVSRAEYRPGMDNACLTVFKIGNNTSLIVHVIVYENGTYEIDIKAIYSVIGSTGIFRGESLTGSSGCSTCVFNDFTLGPIIRGECKSCSVFYRCFLFGDCVNQYSGLGAPMTAYSQYDQYNVSDECKNNLVSIMQSQNLSSTDFVKLPNNLPHQCVTRIGDLVCYRPDSIEPGTGLSLP